jgi:uncharacterized protein YaiL (DUF2058 family)
MGIKIVTKIGSKNINLSLLIGQHFNSSRINLSDINLSLLNFTDGFFIKNILVTNLENGNGIIKL